MTEIENMRYWIEIIERGEIGEPEIVDDTAKSITFKFPKERNADGKGGPPT